MHRSGSSALTRGLQVLGVELGDGVVPEVPFNPKGLFENREINCLSQDLLSHFGLNWDTLAVLEQSDFESLGELPIFGRATDLFRRLTAGTDHFGFKNPRSCILLPFWQQVFRELGLRPRVVLCSRNPLDIAHSLARRNGFSRDKSFLLWLLHMSSVLQHATRDECLVVDYDNLIEAPRRELSRIGRFLDVEVSTRSREIDVYCNGFLDQELRHRRSSAQELREASSQIPQLCDAYQTLTQMAGVDGISASLWEEARRSLLPLRQLWRSLERLDLKDRVRFRPADGAPQAATATLCISDSAGQEETLSPVAPATGHFVFSPQPGRSQPCQLRFCPFDWPCALSLVHAWAGFADGRRQRLLPEYSNAAHPEWEVLVFTQAPVMLFSVSDRPVSVVFELKVHAREKELPIYYGNLIRKEFEQQNLTPLSSIVLSRMKYAARRRLPVLGRLAALLRSSR
jgi:hypothetical protein